MWRRVEIAAKLMLPFLIIFGLLLRMENAYIEDTSYLDDSKDYDWSSDSSYEITLFDTLLCFAWLGVLVFIKVVMWKPPSTDQETSREYAVTPFIHVRAEPVRFVRRENTRTMREFYRNGELISIRLENDNFIYFRHHDEFCAYWFREIIVLYEDGSNTTYSALRCRGDLSGTCLNIQYKWKTVNHDDGDDRCRSNNFCGVFSSRGINDYYYDEFTLCEDILDNMARSVFVKPCERLGHEKADFKGTLVALKSCVLEMLVWFILHDKLRIDLRLSSFKPGPIYTVDDILNGTVADELQNELKSFIMKGHVVSHRRALPPPEISSEVSEERNILEEQRVSDPAITRRWSYCKIAMGCGVAAIGLYAAYKYFR
ncbi:hypothetical protein OS493_036063 [Desmophyllum pertusum]|uniref:Uncharacterized protein n=1 Tax=Desmophyllum pertusum TaxID=174260 RepID=A0A9X0CQI9_9CNID|nr:hypothetical protein OS493_036063 [Desmophyllum pertusum]